MSDKIDYLKYRLDQYKEYQKGNIEFSWDVPKELICMFADFLEMISKDLPENKKWMQTMLKLIADLLRSLILERQSDDYRGVQYANTRG